MTMYMAKLNKATLETVPPDERSLFLSLAHLANEINAFHKLVLWSAEFTPGNNAETSGQVSLMLMFLKLLAGKLNEGNVLLKKKFYSVGLFREYKNSLSAEARETLDKINKYFGQSNTINRVRNNYAFHYSPDELGATLPSVPDELEVYLQQGASANNLYYFAEVVANRALLRSMGLEDEQTAYHQLMQEIVQVAHWFIIVCDSLITLFLGKYAGGIWQEAAIEISFSNLPPFRSIRIPWFTETSGLDAET